MKSRKTAKGDLEKKVGIFFEIGLILALAVVYFAINSRSYKKQSMKMLQQKAPLTIQENVPVTVQKVKQTLPPKPVTQIHLVSNNVNTDENIDIDVGTTPDASVPTYAPAEEPEVAEKLPFQVVEDMPRFQGGEAALMKYLSGHIHYPELAKETGIQGTVFIKFVIESNGRIDRVRVLRGIGGGCDLEAIRVVKNMPKWVPGKQRGKPVAVFFTLPVKFKLQ